MKTSLSASGNDFETAPAGTRAEEPLETAVFAFGSFRDSEARLGFTRGVRRTCAGYAGGTSPNPGRRDPGDHSEAVMIEYAPQTVSYGQLLELVMGWLGEDEGGPRQSGAAIFVRTEQERRLAQAAVDRSVFSPLNILNPLSPSNALTASGTGGASESDERQAAACVPPRVLPFKNFYRAENSCQKYYLHAVPGLYDELLELYQGDEDALLGSTLAARLNGFLRRPSRSAMNYIEDCEASGLFALSERSRRTLEKFIVN